MKYKQYREITIILFKKILSLKKIYKNRKVTNGLMLYKLNLSGGYQPIDDQKR